MDLINNAKILLVDDEPDILEFLTYNLKKEGYRIETASNGREAIEKNKSFEPHLILLDVMMPNLDGIETCYEIRQQEVNKEVLIAMLTARHEEYSEIAGLEAGADDYIHKPIRPRLLMSRIQAILKRHHAMVAHQQSTVIHIDNIKIDPERMEVHVGDQLVNLAKKEFEILQLLASKPGRVYGRDEIYMKIWGSNVIVGTRTIDVHVSKLREKIGDSFIRTIKGIGYKLDI